MADISSNIQNVNPAFTAITGLPFRPGLVRRCRWAVPIRSFWECLHYSTDRCTGSRSRPPILEGKQTVSSARRVYGFPTRMKSRWPYLTSLRSMRATLSRSHSAIMNKRVIPAGVDTTTWHQSAIFIKAV